MLLLHLSLLSLHCLLTASQQNEGSSQASKGVTWYLVSEHLTYASPKCCSHPKSTTLASGEPARIGKCCEMTSSHLRTLPGVFLVNIIFCILLVKLVYISVHARHVWKRMTGSVSSAGNLWWFLCLFLLAGILKLWIYIYTHSSWNQNFIALLWQIQCCY